jgi:hypothetical protein
LRQADDGLPRVSPVTIWRLLHEAGLSEILAELPAIAALSQDPAAPQAAWPVWQAGLMQPFPLPEDLPPLRLVRVWDTLTRLEQLKRLPTDPIIVVVEVFRAKVTLGAKM